MKLFIDTWGWIVLHNRREPHHEEIKAFYQSFRDQKGMMLTTDYVLDETFSLLFRRLPFSQAWASLETLDKAVREVMEELGIADILTEDAHFEQVGMGLRKPP
jgi:predicted nucleic acid-binding protein